MGAGKSAGMRARRATPELGDHGPPERARRGELVPRETAIAGIGGRRVKHECRLDWYQDKASILDRQHAAGLRFRRDWSLATAHPTLIGKYTLRVRGHHEFSDSQIAARRRVETAIRLLGQELAEIAVDVCCYDNWAAGRLPKLRDALTLLADHYGMAREGAA
jgi:hypothetical protein